MPWLLLIQAFPQLAHSKADGQKHGQQNLKEELRGNLGFSYP